MNPIATSTKPRLALLILALLILALPVPAHRAGSARAAAGPQGDAQASGTCLVCGGKTAPSDPVLHYRGRVVRLHAGACEERWKQDPERWFAKLQPAGALFQEPSGEPGALHEPWFWLGLYVVAGLFCSAVAAYLAVDRGQPPATWFFAGLVGNVAALVVLLFVLPRSAADRSPAGIPRGLSKVPVTRAPRACTSCGAALHPAASKCPSCGEDVEPLVASEVPS
jgi:hypothetical protein